DDLGEPRNPKRVEGVECVHYHRYGNENERNGKPLTDLDSTRQPLLRTPSGKPRARSLGLQFAGSPGPLNAITDVPGIEVGYVTLIEGSDVRTGVTAIHPRGKDSPGDPVAAGFHSQNGNGEMTGVSWIEESGTFAGPISITNTHAVGVAHAGTIAWANKHHPALTQVFQLPVAAETWDGYLNDANGHHVTEEVVIEALESARQGPLEEGSVGGGTGMNCYQFKAGSGTASRTVPYGDEDYTVGIFVQANFGARKELVLRGISCGAALAGDNPMEEFRGAPPGAGSIIAIVATDAPLLPHQCKALARRVSLGIARTGTSGSHFSGDLFLAFSTANVGAFSPTLETYFGERQRLDELKFVPWVSMDPFFEAVVEGVEEAIINSLVANEDMVGKGGHRSPALPREKVAEMVTNARRQ
ncbi:MAG TPA: P1 family peptidase, partial [Acidimicrobiales bacterium]|nr:P1 family peptidase [Acidimicrobiales bacterium]